MPGLTPEDFGERMIALLPRLMREFARHDSLYLSQEQITPMHLVALSHLLHNGPTPMSEVAQIMNLKSSSATGLVDRLVKAKWVRRVQDSGDRRVVRVDLTPKGRRIVQEIFKQKQRGFMKIFSSLSAQERATYLEILEKLLRHLGTGENQGEAA